MGVLRPAPVGATWSRRWSVPRAQGDNKKPRTRDGSGHRPLAVEIALDEALPSLPRPLHRRCAARQRDRKDRGLPPRSRSARAHDRLPEESVKTTTIRTNNHARVHLRASGDAQRRSPAERGAGGEFREASVLLRVVASVGASSHPSISVSLYVPSFSFSEAVWSVPSPPLATGTAPLVIISGAGLSSGPPLTSPPFWVGDRAPFIEWRVPSCLPVLLSSFERESVPPHTERELCSRASSSPGAYEEEGPCVV